LRTLISDRLSSSAAAKPAENCEAAGISLGILFLLAGLGGTGIAVFSGAKDLLDTAE
jgi:hypothetical protein